MGRRLTLVGLLALAVAGAVWNLRWPQQGATGVVEVSGTVEATQVDVTPKISGRLVRILVREGDTVRAGQVVAELEPEELEAQVEQAQAALQAARARWEQSKLALALQREQLLAAVRQAEAGVEAADVRVPQAEIVARAQEKTAEVQLEQARAQRAAAEAGVEAAQAQLAAVEANLQAARANRERAELDLRRAQDLAAQGAIPAQQLDAARAAAETARAQVDALVGQREAAARQVQVARAALRQAEAAVQAALAAREAVRARDLDTQGARAVLGQARAALESVQAQRRLVQQREREVEWARAQVEQAEAALRLSRIARGHVSLRAPLAGVVVSRTAEVGELVVPGTVVLTVADLARPYLRVFVSEVDFGRVKLGQRAEVRVDAFPGRTFSGRVAEVSQRPEYTPGNVQTREERTKLVFAVKLELNNPEGLLKPGLPADARILVGGPR